MPDSDAKELLNYRNDFILRKLEVDDSLCVTVALKKNKVEFPLAYSFLNPTFRLSILPSLRMTTVTGS